MSKQGIRVGGGGGRRDRRRGRVRRAFPFRRRVADVLRRDGWPVWRDTGFLGRFLTLGLHGLLGAADGVVERVPLGRGDLEGLAPVGVGPQRSRSS